MEDFAGTVTDSHSERERWFRFEERRQREMIEAWAREQGVEIDFEARK